ncbi:hypothetical protein Acsp04_29840 [Actinomadura sp. NBRC 104425]|uniref:transporter substrate-binding domain-containing protein n=1 Tax=Actinomadura sp. NBRC 104425 TaxID=3032204 RepID=UPI0024A07AAC|nr:transporter substrate-binding domain-containing protein [Actinomadura sp. NBRC 104425]GLZ12749.1 hypothetical protein Acsp04_29840 [Actinomadura sp. NBRC 104425]
MNWRALLGVLLLTAGCGPETEQPPDRPFLERLTVGVANDAPGFSTGSTNLSGFDIDLMHFLADSLQVPAAPTIVTSRNRVAILKNRSVNLVISNFSITRERNEQGVDFAGPYMVTDQALLVRADDHRITDRGSVRGKSICTEDTTTASLVDIPGADMNTKRPTTRDCVEQLAAKGTDAVFNDTLVLYGYVQAHPGKYRVVLPGTFGQLQFYGVAILRGHRDECRKLNEKIKLFLRNDWVRRFQDQFPKVVEEYSGSDDSGNYESEFKPTDADMESLSCKLR